MWINLKFLLIFFLAMGICYLITPGVIFSARKLKILDIPSKRKIHKKPKPLLGGAAIFLTIIPLYIILAFYQRGRVDIYPAIAIIISAVFMFAVGLYDDIKKMSAYTKLVCQIIAANIIFFSGIKITLFVGNNLFQYVVTVVWIVVITNSFNLLDNMDGLSAGTAAICGFLFYVIKINQGEFFAAYLAVILSGAAFGFLRYNFFPSKIFMGDAGSLLLGFLLSVIAIYGTYVRYTFLTRLPLFAPVIIFAVPIFDTLSVIYIRIKSGRSIFKADKRHFSHRLCVLGMTEKQAVLTIYLLTFTTGSVAVLLTKITLAEAVLMLVHTLSIFIVLIIFERASVNKMLKRNKK